MRKLFEYLYYSLYRMFALLKRVGEKDENLASSFYSVLLATNTGLLFFVFRYIIPKEIFILSYIYIYIIKLIYFSLFVIWYLFCKNYFINNKNYIRIISFNETKYKNKNIKLAIIGIIYTLLTFLSFIGFAILLSHSSRLVLNFP